MEILDNFRDFIRSAIGPFDEAISNYQEALRADPRYKQAQQALDRLGKNQ